MTLSAPAPAPLLAFSYSANANFFSFEEPHPAGENDFTAISSGILTIDEGETSGTIWITVNGDVIDEYDEKFKVSIWLPSPSTQVVIDDNQALVTIIDNDAPASISIAAVEVEEGDEGTTSATFTLAVTGQTEKAWSVDYETRDIPVPGGIILPTTPTPAEPNHDYDPTSGTVTVNPSSTGSPEIVVTVHGDQTEEFLEAFELYLSNPMDVTITTGTVLGKIVDDDGRPTLTVNNPKVKESDGQATFTFTLSHPTEKWAISFGYLTSNGSAVVVDDYDISLGTVTIPAGEISQPVVVNVVSDAVDEPSEAFILNFVPDTSQVNTEPGLNAAKATIYGIDLDTDSNNDGTITDSDDPASDPAFETSKAKRILAGHLGTLALAVGSSDADLSNTHVVLGVNFLPVGTPPAPAPKFWMDAARTTPIATGTPLDPASLPTSLYIDSAVQGQAVVTATLVSSSQGTVAGDSVFLTFVGGAFGLQSVNFLGHDHLVSDPSSSGQTTDYSSSSEWLDENANGSIDGGGDHRFPVSYDRGDSPTVTVSIANAGTHLGSVVTIRGLAADGTVIVAANEATESNDIYTISNVALSGVVGQSVRHLPDYSITWQFSTDGGGTWAAAGTSVNTIYVTYATPLVSTLYETLVYIGSHHADGATSESATVAGAWSPFDSLTVRKVDETQLTYYDDDWLTTAMTTAELLMQNDGRCGAWSRFFADVLRAQGLAAEDRGVVPKSIHPSLTVRRLLVKNYGFSDPSPWTLPEGKGIAHRLSSVEEQGGIEAQGNGDPVSHFEDHGLVIYAGLIYDPSYGGGPYTTLQAWEDAAIAGILFTAIDSSGVEHDWVLKHEPGRPDTQFLQ